MAGVRERHRVGELVYGRITKLVPFGAFVQVGDGIEGLVHISEMAAHHVELPEQVVTPGEELWVKIIDIDLERRRISLSIKQAAEGGEVAEEYREAFGEHAYDAEGNYIGDYDYPTTEFTPETEAQAAWAEFSAGEAPAAAGEPATSDDAVAEPSRSRGRRGCPLARGRAAAEAVPVAEDAPGAEDAPEAPGSRPLRPPPPRPRPKREPSSPAPCAPAQAVSLSRGVSVGRRPAWHRGVGAEGEVAGHVWSVPISAITGSCTAQIDWARGQRVR